MPENEKEIKTTSSKSSHGSSSHHHSHHHRHHHKQRRTLRDSLLGFLQKKSTSRKYKPIPQYRVMSQRILFCMLLLCFVYFTVAGMLTEDNDPAITTASTTRSETDQLKVQITILQQEKNALIAELDRYKALYGELDGSDTTEVLIEEENEENEEN